MSAGREASEARAPGRWQTWHKTWRWAQRVDAFDMSMQMAREDAVVEELRTAAKKTAAAGHLMLDMALENLQRLWARLKDKPNLTLRPETVIRLARHGADLVGVGEGGGGETIEDFLRRLEEEETGEEVRE